jgi:hypothetical protein
MRLVIAASLPALRTVPVTAQGTDAPVAAVTAPSPRIPVAPETLVNRPPSTTFDPSPVMVSALTTASVLAVQGVTAPFEALTAAT